MEILSCGMDSACACASFVVNVFFRNYPWPVICIYFHTNSRPSVTLSSAKLCEGIRQGLKTTAPEYCIMERQPQALWSTEEKENRYMSRLDFLSSRGGGGCDGRCKLFSTSLCSYFGSAQLPFTINTGYWVYRLQIGEGILFRQITISMQKCLAVQFQPLCFNLKS